MNENRNKHFKLKLNKKRNKFQIMMETIDKEDTLTLVISKPEG